MEQFKLHTPRGDTIAIFEQQRKSEVNVTELLQRIRECNPKNPIILSYASIFNDERTFWQLTLKGDSAQARSTIENIQSVIRANSKTGYHFTMKNGLRCTVKRANLTRRQHQIIDWLRMTYNNEPEYLSWLIDELKNTTYLFSFRIDKHVFGMGYNLCNFRYRGRKRTTHVDALKMVRIVDALAQNKPPKPNDIRLDWLFCDDCLFEPRNPRAQIVVLEAIRNNLSPSITALMIERRKR